MRSVGIDVQAVRIAVADVMLDGDLAVPDDARGFVIFAHASRLSSRNRFVAHELQSAGIGTLLMDLLTREEEQIDSGSGHLRFDIGLLAERLVGVRRWTGGREDLSTLPVAISAPARVGGLRWWQRRESRRRWQRSCRGADVRIWRGRRFLL